MSGRAYGGVSAAERLEQRRRRLLDAAADVIRERGVSDTTYRAVVIASGLTERYFYESYANLDELLLAVAEEELQAALAGVLAQVAGAASDPRAAMEGGIRSFVERFADNRLFSRLLVESPAHPQLSAHRRTAISTFVDFMLHMASTVVREPVDAREQRLARHVAVMLVGGFNELLAQWVESGLVEDREEIIQDVVELFESAMTHYSTRH